MSGYRRLILRKNFLVIW